MTRAQTDQTSLDRYVAEIKRHPVLGLEEELELGRRYRETGDQQAANRLVESNLRFVLKIAHEYGGYDVDLLDLIQEGNAGLVMAVKKFDPERGHRLISYAVWWIRAYLRAYVLRNYSLVRLGTTQGQRRAFYRLRAERQSAERAGEPATAEDLAKRLRVPLRDVKTMDDRLRNRDTSLDAPRAPGSEQPWVDAMAAPGASAEEQVSREEVRRQVAAHVQATLPELGPKHRYVLKHRLLADEGQALATIGKSLALSRERVRQIEAATLRHLRRRLDGMDQVAA